jgi:predicted Fe-S protein YdhL (DUF1289 family)
MPSELVFNRFYNISYLLSFGQSIKENDFCENVIQVILIRMNKFDYDNYISPCRNICKLDVDGKFCIGCYRTTDEIGGWKRFSKEEKLTVMAILPKRENKGFPFDKK